MLADFTAVSSIALSYKYDMSESQLEQMSPFGRSIWEAKTNSDIVYPSSTHPLYLSNQGGKLNTGILWDAIINGQKVKYITQYYKDNKNAVTEDYFQGIINDYESSFKK